MSLPNFSLRSEVYSREDTRAFWRNQNKLSPAEKAAQHAERPALHAAVVLMIAIYINTMGISDVIPGGIDLLAQIIYDMFFPKQVGYDKLKEFATNPVVLNRFVTKAVDDKENMTRLWLAYNSTIAQIHASVIKLDEYIHSPDFNEADTETMMNIMRDDFKDKDGKRVSPLPPIDTRRPFWLPMSNYFLLNKVNPLPP